MPEEELQLALQNCSLHPLLMIVSRALTRAGYGDVQFLDRRLSRQKSRFGGHDLLCQATLGTRSVKVIVKVIRDSARIRMLDELSGAVRRTKADMGLLVTPFHVTKTAQSLLPAYSPHIQVLDGPALTNLLAGFGIGIRGKGQIDYAFFGSLEEVSDSLLQFMKAQRI